MVKNVLVLKQLKEKRMENKDKKSPFNFKEDKLINKGNYYLYYLSQSDLKKLRDYFATNNVIFCPILKKKIDIDKTVVDHQHKLKSEEPDKDRGQVRAILEFRANAMAGKIENLYKRYGFHKEDISLPELLRNIADYLENDSITFEHPEDQNKIYLIHPNEVPKRKKVSKRDLNLLIKWWSVLKPRAKKGPKFTYETEEFLRLLEKAKELNDKYKNVKKYFKEINKR